MKYDEILSATDRTIDANFLEMTIVSYFGKQSTHYAKETNSIYLLSFIFKKYYFIDVLHLTDKEKRIYR